MPYKVQKNCPNDTTLLHIADLSDKAIKGLVGAIVLLTFHKKNTGRIL